MADDHSNWTGIPGSQDYFSSGTSASPTPKKVGFEQVWKTGWQSVTSTSVTSPVGTSSVTMTQADQSTNPLRVKRARREIRWFKVG